MTDRYDGKPFLRLRESYVLWAVDQLPSDQAEVLEDLAPKLRSTDAVGGNWQEIVAAQMEFPAELPSALRQMWERTRPTLELTGTRSIWRTGPGRSSTTTSPDVVRRPEELDPRRWCLPKHHRRSPAAVAELAAACGPWRGCPTARASPW